MAHFSRPCLIAVIDFGETVSPMKKIELAASSALVLCGGLYAQVGNEGSTSESMGWFDGGTGLYETCMMADGIGGGLWHVLLQGRNAPGAGVNVFSLELIAAEEAAFERCASVFDKETGLLSGLVRVHGA